MGASSGGAAAAKQSAALRISSGLVGLVARYAGRGPSKARTTVNTNHVLCVFRDVLSKPEQHLLERGSGEVVVRMRSEVFKLMRDESIELIETALGRKVVSCMSDFDVNGNVAVQVFLLDPLPEDGLAITAEAEA